MDNLEIEDLKSNIKKRILMEKNKHIQNKIRETFEKISTLSSETGAIMQHLTIEPEHFLDEDFKKRLEDSFEIISAEVDKLQDIENSLRRELIPVSQFEVEDSPWLHN